MQTDTQKGLSQAGNPPKEFHEIYRYGQEVSWRQSVKYIPQECIKFPTYGDRYYQITAIDEYSRKRTLKVVKEKSTYETSRYLRELAKRLGFRIKTVQVDNGPEFVNGHEVTDKEGPFEQTAQELVIDLKRIRPVALQ